MSTIEVRASGRRRWGAAGLRRGLAAVALAALLHAQPVHCKPLLYKAGPGPGNVAMAEVTLDIRGADQPPMALRAVFPRDAKVSSPLIVFSHGTFSSNAMYDLVVDHWASWGYVVLLPNHVDANHGVAVQGKAGMEAIIESRAADLSLVLDHLDDIEQAVPALRGEIRRTNPVAAGHSVGSYVAMLAAGLQTKNPLTGAVTRRRETRYAAVLMLSDPGKMALMPTDLWKGAVVPTFLSTGTADYGLMGDGRRPTEYEMEVLSGAGIPPGIRYELVIQKGDHYFGGLIHRKIKAQPDYQGLRIFNSLSTAFLDAYSRKDAAALTFLRDADIKAATRERAELLRE